MNDCHQRNLKLLSRLSQCKKQTLESFLLPKAPVPDAWDNAVTGIISRCRSEADATAGRGEFRVDQFVEVLHDFVTSFDGIMNQIQVWCIILAAKDEPLDGIFDTLEEGRKVCDL